MKQTPSVWIVDFGSQYTQLITRRCRELGLWAEILTFEKMLEKKEEGLFSPKALILSGGPDSLFDDDRNYSDLFTWAPEEKPLPILGICYGMQMMARHFGGKVKRGLQGEYGSSLVHFRGEEIKGIGEDFSVWMSHNDHVDVIPPDFRLILESSNRLVAGIRHHSLPLMGLQFHPEVEHTEHGREVLAHFLRDIAKLENDWDSDRIYETALASLPREDKEGKILCAFSGGVDSLVGATLAEKVYGDRLVCLFIDNGLVRPQDERHIRLLQEKTNLNIVVEDAREIFWQALAGESDPEKKRKIIGKTFIEVFESKVKEWEQTHSGRFSYLLQGTLYPDVIESISPHGKGGRSVTIKSHHNVGGLPEKMRLKLIEPLRSLFKDEVRQLGEKMGLPSEWVYRHPFPGPGLGVRILGDVNKKSLKKVRHSDEILFEELNNFDLYKACWQAFTVLLPVKTVGIKGDARAYEEVICLRIVQSTDGMTAKWCDFPFNFLEKTSSRITNEVEGVTRVVYDITSKPPGTIEWE